MRQEDLEEIDRLRGDPRSEGRSGAAPEARPTRFRVIGAEDGLMLRQLLAKRLKVPPAVAAELVRAGGVYLGPVRMCVPTIRVAEGERVTVYRAAATVQTVEPAALRVVHRDAACVVVDKPHGVPAAATKAASRGTVAHALVQLLEQERVARPYVGLVHALPAAAAGLVLFTIRGQATESFFKQFAGLATTRRYVVRVAGLNSGAVRCDAAVVETPGGSWRLARGTGREGVATSTEVARIAELGEEALAEVTLTGGGLAGGEAVRLHLGALGLRIVGEGAARPEEAAGTEGVNAGPEGLLCLLAAELGFTQPRTGEVVRLVAERPGWAIPGG
jgi:23S rRNA pseudouridine1911/1915/1917 synthase